MHRLTRLYATGDLHHIIIRGIERGKIFIHDHDKDNFIDRLAAILLESQTVCYGWVLMSNHVHFLFRSGGGGTSNVMRRLLTGYAIWFNHKYRRHGQLFHNRYKSIICQEDLSFKELVRYIHLNPLRAGLVADIRALGKYPYCGHCVLMGNIEQIWHDTKYVLSYFGKKPSEAKGGYLLYVKKSCRPGTPAGSS